jgi:hypothetical protein
MSAASVETILSRAMSDSAFADRLFANPERALSDYDLTVEETTALKGITQAEVEAFAKASPEERKSFGWGPNHNETALHVG